MFIPHLIELIMKQLETPFKEPHRRTPPALFQEVREHLKKMLDARKIRPSKSPYSSERLQKK